ncbi:MAG TPA: hypothetical protein VK619_04110 [Pyrinomonadaceae bacterium]|nr:hypothetical protein [Pyrinomonadaceae bacterium]
MIKFLRLCFFILALVFCTVVAVDARAQGAGDIHRVDFKNFTYHPSCSFDNRQIRTRNGAYNRNRQDDRMEFKIGDIVYGDLTNDGRDEAVVISRCSTGGTGFYTEGYVYTMRGSRPVEIVRLEMGDRALGGIFGVKISGGLLTVERYAPDVAGEGACCPKYIETTTYRLRGRRLVQVGRKRRRNAETENN